ncbi:MAG: amylo-alpha-1,6-glucosidase, partial [Actinomycetota bacterium]|nr:amylo-alpha-1,6-glucosidase [Actinomycetota bacterium]
MHRQPLLSAELVVLRAPTQAWSSQDGSMGSSALHGVYFGDVRVIASHAITVDGATPEHIATSAVDASTVRVVSLLRAQDDPGADPDVQLELHRTAGVDSFTETVTITSRLDRPLSLAVRIALDLDSSSMDAVKQGARSVSGGVTTQIDAGTGMLREGATLDTGSWSVGPNADAVLTWTVDVPARGSGTAHWSARFTDAAAVVRGVDTPVPWKRPDPTGDERLDRWLGRALGDLDALRMTRAAASTDETSAVAGEAEAAGAGDARDPEFIAAGAPWFFTLFGRDSIWTARFLLPLGVRAAADTLQVLAALQGVRSDIQTAEQPGKIMHELRRGTTAVDDFELPPLYYGTIDATPLWICLLHDAWRWGMPSAEVEALLRHLEAALAWMRDFGDADGDGLLEY